MEIFNESTVNNELFITENKFMSSLYIAGNELITETSLYDMTLAISQYIQKVINDIVAFVKSVKSDIVSLARRRDVVHKLKELKKTLQNQKDLGIKKIMIFDYKNYATKYNKMVTDNLKDFAVLLKKKYKYKSEIEMAMNKFEQTLTKRDKELDEAYEKKVLMDINEAISYVEQNLSGKISIESTLQDATSEMNRLRIESERIFKNIRLSEESEIRSTYVGSVRRSLTRVSKSCSKGFKKFVVRVVCLFA